MFSGQFYEKTLSVRERNLQFLQETVTYIAITEKDTCIIKIETVNATALLQQKRSNSKRKFHLHNCNRMSKPAKLQWTVSPT